jgi:hypothetical protein
MWYKAMRWGWYCVIFWTVVSVIECGVGSGQGISALIGTSIVLIGTTWLGAWKRKMAWSQMSQTRKFFLGLFTIPSLGGLLLVVLALKIFGGVADESIERNRQRSIIRDGVRDALNDRF